MVTERKGCDTCRFADFHKEVRCQHPERPEDKRVVVRWYKGCPQHQPKEKQ